MVDYIGWLRAQTGHQPLLLVYTTAVIFNEDGEVLIQHRADFEWSGLPGGLLEPDEDLSACVVREVYEETGLNVAIERLEGVFSHPDYTLIYPHGDVVQPWTVCFTCRITGGQLRADGKETTGLQFYPPAETFTYMPPQHRAMLHHALGCDPDPVLEPAVHAPPDQSDYILRLRDHVGSSCLIAPGVTAVVRDARGYVLATLRRDFGTWDLPGGWCELGETVTASVVRETREETGLEVRPLRMTGIYSNPNWMITYPNGDQVRPIGAMFECEIVGGELRADGDESLEVAFVDPTGQGEDGLDDSPLHRVFWHDASHPRAEPYIR